MKKLLTLCLLLSLSTVSLAQESLTTFILVRHAEKASDDPRNPTLTEEGYARAERLKSLLSSTDLSAIYSTPYKRTQLTVKPTAEANSTEVQAYDPRSMDFVNSILKDHAGGTILVSGHSNTTPMVANFLLGEKKFEWLKEDEYDKVFIVTVSKIGTGTVNILSY